MKEENEIIEILEGFVETYAFDNMSVNVIHPDDIPKIAARLREQSPEVSDDIENAIQNYKETGNITPPMCSRDCVGPHCEGCRKFEPIPQVS